MKRPYVNITLTTMSSDNTRPTSFEDLSTEILLQIFAYLRLPELVTTFSGLNSYIDSVIRSVKSASHVVRYNDNDAINLLHLFPTQIGHLMIVNVEMVNLTLFINLRSLTLKYGTGTQFNSIRPQNIPMLEILHIKGLHTTVNRDTETINNLFEVILSNGFPRLRICTALDLGALTFNNTWTGSLALRTLNLNLKTTLDCEQLRSICPRLRRLTTYDSSMVFDQTKASVRAYRRILCELRRLERLELENKFILQKNFLTLIDNQKLPARFNNTTIIGHIHEGDLFTFQGRILPQTEPYCHASFLIQIKLSPEYPFKEPEVIFLDPIYHPNVNDRGHNCCCWGLPRDVVWRPSTQLTDLIRAVIGIIDSKPDSMHGADYQRIAEYQNDYSKFYKKALKLTLSYGRPRY